MKESVNVFSELSKLFAERKTNVVLYADTTAMDNKDIYEYIRVNPNNYSKILIADFDRRKYLYTRDMPKLSYDTILKKCLSRVFISEKINYSERYMNYLLEFENSIDENTLVVIDNYDLPYALPYMKHLFNLCCSVLVISECGGDFTDNAVAIKRDCSLCCEDLHITDAVSILDERQKELLMTLCAILFHLDENVKIKCSRTGVFDEEALRYYLRDLSDELSVLVRKGLVMVSDKGRISIPESVSRYVLSVLKPNIDNCSTFISFVEENCDFTINQNDKDIYGSFSVYDTNPGALSFSDELLCAYTHFCMDDNDAGRKLYNMIMPRLLCSSRDKSCVFDTSLFLLRNRCMYLSVIANYLRNSEKAKLIYDDDIYYDRVDAGLYTRDVLCELDIIRLCTFFLRNLTHDLYKESEYVFALLLSSLERIHEMISANQDDSDETVSLVDTVIRLCFETFGYGCALDSGGGYFPLRENINKSRVFYVWQKESDTLFASSLSMGYSETTLRLYACFQKFLGMYLLLTENSVEQSKGKLLHEIEKRKREVFQKLCRDIYLNFRRITMGLDFYDDYYSEKYLKNCRYQCVIPKDIDKILAKNSRCLAIGFDKGTKIGAERYSDMIIGAVTGTEDPLRVLAPIMSVFYPLNECTYRNLSEKGLHRIIAESKQISNLTKHRILEAAAEAYCETSGRDEYVGFMRNLISSLVNAITFTGASENRLSNSASSMFVRCKIRELTGTKDVSSLANADFAYSFYKNHANVKGSSFSSDGYIAKIIFDLCNNNNSKFNREVLSEALFSFSYETKCLYTLGVIVLAKELLGNDMTVCLYDKIKSIDVFGHTDKEAVEKILQT